MTNRYGTESKMSSSTGAGVQLLTIIGARPQFVKAAVVSREIARVRESGEADVREILVHTGQHFDANMSDVFFSELGIPEPDHHLGIAGGPHGEMTGRMLSAIEAVLEERRPDWVLVYGDTNSTLAGALAAAKLHIPVAHVEAGLRSYNRRMPEEINRVVTDHVSELLLAPTATAVENLRREGIAHDQIHDVGDVMYDAALYYGAHAESRSRFLAEQGLETGGFVLATVHRAENTGDPRRLAAIVEGLSRIAADLPVVLPLHPRTRAVMSEQGISADAPGLRTIDPLGYLDMVMAEKSARLIVTDSGGVQKEAFFHRVPCITLRDETEWVELVELGWNRLVPPVAADVVEAEVRAALSAAGGRDEAPYGRGDAAARIVRLLSGSGNA